MEILLNTIFPWTKLSPFLALFLQIIFPVSNLIGQVNGEVAEGHITRSTEIFVCSESALPSRKTLPQPISVETVEKWKFPETFMSTQNPAEFYLRVNEPECSGGGTEEVIEISEDANKTSPLTTHFYPNGYFRHYQQVYAPDEYCVERFSLPKYPFAFVTNFSESHEESMNSSSTIASITMRLCTPDCEVGKKRLCIRKCCPLNQIFRGGGKGFCTPLPPGSFQFMPSLYYDYNRPATKFASKDGDVEDRDVSYHPTADYIRDTSVVPVLPHFTINNPRRFIKNCLNSVLLPYPTSEAGAKLLTESSNSSIDYQHFPFRIRTDGAIMFKSLASKCEIRQSLDNLCVDGMRGAWTDSLQQHSPFKNTEDEYILFQCQIVEKDPHMEKYLSFTFGLLLLITSVCPLLTCLVYILLWKKQQIAGTIAATSGSLFFMYIFQGSAHLIGIYLNQAALNTFFCQLLGILAHFFMMSTFTWLTVMSCDLWLTFRSLTPANRRVDGTSRYLKYSIFAWGIPVFIVLVGILMDFVIYSSEDCYYHAVPGYGQQSCWIMENSLGLYLYYPAAFLLCINIAFFTATCIKLAKYGRSPMIRTRKNNDALGECFSRFTKLFCVMGISWIFEILSWYVDGLGFVWYWNIFDLFNILRAVGVFIIYVCKKDIIMQLEATNPCLRTCLSPFDSLFLRKCSEDVRTDTTVLTAVPVPGSPAIPPKSTNHNATSAEEQNQRRNTLDIPK